MVRIAVAQLVRRPGRTLALLAGVLLATASFTVLTGAARTGRLEVRGTIERQAPAAYDVLVRPRGARSATERSRALVRPGVLSGIFGGITLRQWHRVRDVPGVEVAAPIATIGYSLPQISVPVPLPGRGAGVYRVRVRRGSDRGLSSWQDAPVYAYVTPRKLSPEHGGREDNPRNYAPEETVRGTRRAVCVTDSISRAPQGPFDRAARGAGEGLDCWSRRTGLRGDGFYGLRRPSALVPATLPFLIAAIDPESEARLAGLDRAVVQGRYLRGGDRPRGTFPPRVPVLVADRPYADETMRATLERLPASAVRAVRRPLIGGRLQRALDRAPGRPLRSLDLSAQDIQDELVSQLRGSERYFPAVTAYWSVGPTSYAEGADGDLVPRAVRNRDAVWESVADGGYVRPPLSAQDPAFRRLTGHEGAANAELGNIWPSVRAVGTFSPARMPGFEDALRAPLQTYASPALAPADARSSRLLGGRPLLPNGNLAGYATQPPLLLTTLRSLPAFGRANFRPNAGRAPISAIRVKVAGVRGVDAASRERVRRAAERIQAITGLDVDLTIGSSPAPLVVELPAGSAGRPALRLRELWVRKGVAIAILAAVDRKSLALFVLILVVCSLFVANAAGAAVRARRTELATLACLGWTRGRLSAAILLEVGLVSLAGAALGVAIAVPAAAALGVPTSLARVALAIPAAVVLALLAAAWPALRAAGSRPLDAMRPPVLGARRARSPRGVVALALTNLVRVPGRTALAAAGLAIGVAAFALLLALTLQFRGVLVGTLLGDVISVQIRAVDYVAVAAVVALAGLGVADVLYLNLRERAGELATLRAVGWDERALRRLVLAEGAAIGLAGAGAGAIAGVAGAAALAGALPAGFLLAALAALAGGVLVAVIATLVPARLLRRLDTVQLLALE